jgi:hypothetical protein
MGKRTPITTEEQAAHRDARWAAERARRAEMKEQNPDDWRGMGLAAERMNDSPSPKELAGLSMIEAYKRLELIKEDEKGKIEPGYAFIIDPRLVVNLAYLGLDGVDYAIVMRVLFHHWT